MLTDAAIKALKPKDKLYKIVDRDGMYVVVQPSGAIVFRLDYRLNGRRETLTLGRYGPAGLSLARAREKVVDARRAISEGRSPAQEKQREKRRRLTPRLARSGCGTVAVVGVVAVFPGLVSVLANSLAVRADSSSCARRCSSGVGPTGPKGVAIPGGGTG